MSAADDYDFATCKVTRKQYMDRREKGWTHERASTQPIGRRPVSVDALAADQARINAVLRAWKR